MKSCIRHSSLFLFEVSSSLMMEVRTVRRSLNAMDPSMQALRADYIPPQATHFVSSITYGADCAVSFRQTASSEEFKRDIQASLEGKIRTLSYELEVAGSYKKEDLDVEDATYIGIDIHGDIIPGDLSGALADSRASRRLASRRLNTGHFEGCASTAGWTDGTPAKNGCDHYEQGQCSSGYLSDPKGAHALNFPNLHCCACGRCADNPGWTDGQGLTCGAYRAQFCDGQAYTGDAPATLKNRPDENCCGCGRCADTLGWSDDALNSCDWYADESNGMCKDGKWLKESAAGSV